MRVSLFAVALFVVGCGPDESSNDLDANVKWAFLEGDCSSNMVTKVKVSWGPSGATKEDVEFDCSAGQGKVGTFSSSGGEYGFTAVGVDSAGVARFTHFGTSVTVGSRGTFGTPIDLTLRPKPADVLVTWRMSNGGGCPTGFVLPYTITLYKPPAMMGGALTDQVQETQVSCSTQMATLENVTPGSYVVQLDSRAQNPMVKGTKPVTVKGGENAMVDFQF
jgi:hypothetical protein